MLDSDAWRALHPAKLEIQTNQQITDDVQRLARELGVTPNSLGRFAIDSLLNRKDDLIKLSPDRIDLRNQVGLVGILESPPKVQGPNGAKQASADLIVFTPENSDVVRISTRFEDHLVGEVGKAKGNERIFVWGHLSADRIRHPWEDKPRFEYILRADVFDILRNPASITETAPLRMALLIAQAQAPREVKIMPSSDHHVRV